MFSLIYLEGGSASSIAPMVSLRNEINKIISDKTILMCEIYQKNDIFYILIGEDHYRIAEEIEKYNKICENITSFLTTHKPNIFLEYFHNSDREMYENYIGEFTKRKNIMIEIHKITVPKQIFDIRDKYNCLDKIDNMMNIILNIHSLKVNGSDEHNALLSQMIIEFLDDNFISRSIIYLLKNEISEPPNIKKKYDDLLGYIKQSRNDLIKYMDEWIRTCSEVNIELIEKIMFKNDANITDLTLYKLINNNSEKLNFIYGGKYHINNAIDFLKSEDFLKVN